MIRILLVDDHKIFRQGIAGLLQSLEAMELVGEAGTGSAGVRLAWELKPDVIVMDIGLPDFSGIEAIKRIRNQDTETAVILLTMHKDEDLLDMARPPKYHFAKTDISSLLKQTVDLMEAEMQTRHIQFECILSADLPSVRADSDQLVKAFQNLIQNAAQAMSAGGELTIEAYYEQKTPIHQHMAKNRNRWVTVTFQDTGPGIPADAIKNIFNPFFSTKDNGTGLGLAITHKVITEHGGSIEVTSCPERGTRFTVGLPVRN